MRLTHFIIKWNINLRNLHGPYSTQRQARELISGPDLATRTRCLSFTRAQSRIVIDLFTGHNTLRRHLYEGWNFNSGNYLFTTDTK